MANPPKVKFIWFNGKMMPSEKATIHLLNHSLHYGSAVFEGERFYETDRGPAIFRLDDHTGRLFRSAQAVGIRAPYAREEIIEATKYQVLNINSFNKTHEAKNTNVNVNQIPGLIASKTGYTEMAGGNIVIAFDSSIGKPIIVVVLGSSEEGRFKDISALVDASLKYVKE